MHIHSMRYGIVFRLLYLRVFRMLYAISNNIHKFSYNKFDIQSI